MSQQALEQIMSRYESDEAFRVALRTDPFGTVEAAGIVIDDDVRAMLQQIEPGMTAEDIKQRVGNGHWL